MRSFIILVFLMLISWDGISSAYIDGNDTVCPLTSGTFQIVDTDCPTNGIIEDIDWYTIGDLSGAVPFDQMSTTITFFPNSSFGDTIYVEYNCNYTIGSTAYSIHKKLKLAITILSIQVPLFANHSLLLYCDSLSTITLTTPAQTGVINENVTYEWTYPDCFTSSGSLTNNGVFISDKATSGEICLKVSYPECLSSVEECVVITRACQDYETFTSTYPITGAYVSRNITIKTIGNVSTSGFPSVEFKAGKAIHLGPGFSGVPNFLAHIAPCTCFPEGSVGCMHRPSPGSQENENATMQQHSSGVNTIKEQSRKKEMEVIMVFPNPTSGLTTIAIEHFDVSKQYKLVLYNATGQFIQTFDMTSNKTDIDLSSYENGIYLATFTDGYIKKAIRLSKTN